MVVDETVALDITLTPLVPDETTRTTVVIDQSGAKFSWATDDIVGIFSSESDQVRFALGTGAGSTTATFTGGGWGLRNDYSYAAYYPYEADNSNRGGNNVLLDYTKQKQVGDNSYANIGICDFMSTAITTPVDKSLSLTFNHLGALLLIKLTLPEATENALTMLSLKASRDVIPVKQSIDLLSASTPAAITDTELSSELSMTLEGDIKTTDENKVLRFYMMVPAMCLQTNGVILKARLTDGINEYEGTLTSAGLTNQVKDLAAGKIYAVSATLEYCSISGSAGLDSFTQNQW